jgi:FMN phosphatase YigB (HAD superfamily)
METGEISPGQYYERFTKVSGCRISFRHFSLIWARYFTDSRPMIELGRSLSCNFRIYFLSNTDPLHIPVLYSRFPNALFSHGQALSYELGALKPDRSFFERALAKFALKPSECLFIDDQAQNVEAARDFGMRTIQHFDPRQTKAEIIAEFERDGISLEL